MKGRISPLPLRPQEAQLPIDKNLLKHLLSSLSFPALAKLASLNGELFSTIYSVPTVDDTCTTSTVDTHRDSQLKESKQTSSKLVPLVRKRKRDQCDDLAEPDMERKDRFRPLIHYIGRESNDGEAAPFTELDVRVFFRQSNCLALTTIEWVSCSIVGDETLEYATALCPNLERLRIAGCAKISSGAMNAVMNGRLSRLTEVDIRDAHSVQSCKDWSSQSLRRLSCLETQGSGIRGNEVVVALLRSKAAGLRRLGLNAVNESSQTVIDVDARSFIGTSQVLDAVIRQNAATLEAFSAGPSLNTILEQYSSWAARNRLVGGVNTAVEDETVQELGKCMNLVHVELPFAQYLTSIAPLASSSGSLTLTRLVLTDCAALTYDSYKAVLDSGRIRTGLTKIDIQGCTLIESRVSSGAAVDTGGHKGTSPEADIEPPSTPEKRAATSTAAATAFALPGPLVPVRLRRSRTYPRSSSFKADQKSLVLQESASTPGKQLQWEGEGGAPLPP